MAMLKSTKKARLDNREVRMFVPVNRRESSLCSWISVNFQIWYMLTEEEAGSLKKAPYRTLVSTYCNDSTSPSPRAFLR